MPRHDFWRIIMLLYFLRHADPIYDPDSLTPLGHRQAEALARRVTQYGLDEIYCSSSMRAQQTAQPTCEILKMDMTILDWANEKYAWQQLACPTEDGRRIWAFQQPKYIKLFRRPEVMAMGQKWYEHEYFSETRLAEGVVRIQNEAWSFLEKLGYKRVDAENGYMCTQPNDKRIALFAHQGFGLAFLSAVLGVPYNLFSTSFDMGHSGMSVIEFPAQEGYVVPVMLQMANDSHLFRDGLPTNYQNRIRF